MKKLLCLLLGHPVVPTGRSSWAMAEHRCSRCSATLVSHRDHGRRLIALTPDLDSLFASCSKLESLASSAAQFGIPLVQDPVLPPSPNPNPPPIPQTPLETPFWDHSPNFQPTETL